MRDLTKEFLDKAQEHVNRTGKLPPLVGPDTAKRLAREAATKLTEMVTEVHSIIHKEGRDPYPEELELLETIKSSTHTHGLDTSFWGDYLMVWDARLKHFQNAETDYAKQGIYIARTTSIYSYHACEISEVCVSNLSNKTLFVVEPVYATWDPKKEEYNNDGLSAWQHAWQKMREEGFTHYFHRGRIRPNYGDTPYGWMSLKDIKEEQAKD